MKEKFYHKGFTFVELLIVLIVIGILSAVMLISTVEVTASADASIIMNNLQQIKMATITWRAHNRDKIKANGQIKDKDGTGKSIQNINKNDALGIGKYLNDGSIKLNEIDTQDNNKEKMGGYAIFDVPYNNNYNTWYVGYRFRDAERPLKAKLKEKGASLGLHFVDLKPDGNSGDGRAWLKICGDWEPASK